MFEYAFLQSPVTFLRGSLDRSGYQSLIHERAREGWRLVQVLVEVPAAMPTEYCLIFERRVAA